MSCKPVCKLCDHFIVSQDVTYASGVLTINIPAGTYQNGEKYCIVIGQNIPADTIIGAPVVITIGTSSVPYPLVKRNCSVVTACGIRTRTKYSVIVSTGTSNAAGAVFKMLGQPCCAPDNSLASIDGTSPTPSPSETPARLVKEGK
nr:MAG TPA: hypothetical protein [Bacteriophage sp.]